MGINVRLPKTGDMGKDIQPTYELPINYFIENPNSFFPAEWYPQSGVQLTWPHADTDWKCMLEEVQSCFIKIAEEISKKELVMIVAEDIDSVKKQLKGKVCMENVRFVSCKTNDTWARDHGGITLIEEGQPLILDFCFNGWGMKFAANYDNQITREAFKQGLLHGNYKNCLNFVFEGGSIESDGKGTLLTTKECLLSPNRNAHMNQVEIEIFLKSVFHVQQVLWLDHGFLQGDDTDSHIDTLARICPNDTITYVECKDENDIHYEALLKMKEQLKSYRTLEGQPYRLLALPMAEKVEEEGERLPATYANFLIINGAVLYPTYNNKEKDEKAAEILSIAFPDREIIGIDCRALIKQHGSLHCVTMQYPVNVLK